MLDRPNLVGPLGLSLLFVEGGGQRFSTAEMFITSSRHIYFPRFISSDETHFLISDFFRFELHANIVQSSKKLV